MVVLVTSLPRKLDLVLCLVVLGGSAAEGVTRNSTGLEFPTSQREDNCTSSYSLRHEADAEVLRHFGG